MILKNEWFPLSNDKNDIENVLFFLEKLPSKIEYFINPKYSDLNEVLDKNMIAINSDLIKNSFVEAKNEFEADFIKFKRKYRIRTVIGENTMLIEKMAEDLMKIGFTENSLKLKASILNTLWKQVIEYLEKIGSNVMRFSDSKFTKVLMSFLNFLNSILCSLININTSLDILKEFKEIIEGIININENINIIKS